MIKSERITILTKKYNQMIVITGQVEEIVRNSGIKDGVVFIITNHTTTGITVNEGLECIQSDLTGNHCVFEVQNHEMKRRFAQEIYLCEFDGPQERTISVIIMGE